MEVSDRPPSPVPSASPCTREEFCGLDLHQQLGHTKEVLQAVLNDSYPPARPRHQRFMKGGKERAALDRDASLKGVMTSKEVSKLTKLLIRWVLRDSVIEHLAEDCEVCVSVGDIGLGYSYPMFRRLRNQMWAQTLTPHWNPHLLRLLDRWI